MMTAPATSFGGAPIGAGVDAGTDPGPSVYKAPNLC